MAIPYQFVIDSTTKLVVRHGYSDFASDGALVSGEEVVIGEPVGGRPGRTPGELWYWHASSRTVSQTPPE